MWPSNILPHQLLTPLPVAAAPCMSTLFVYPVCGAALGWLYMASWGLNWPWGQPASPNSCLHLLWDLDGLSTHTAQGCLGARNPLCHPPGPSQASYSSQHVASADTASVSFSWFGHVFSHLWSVKANNNTSCTPDNRLGYCISPPQGRLQKIPANTITELNLHFSVMLRSVKIILIIYFFFILNPSQG